MKFSVKEKQIYDTAFQIRLLKKNGTIREMKEEGKKRKERGRERIRRGRGRGRDEKRDRKATKSYKGPALANTLSNGTPKEKEVILYLLKHFYIKLWYEVFCYVGLPPF